MKILLVSTNTLPASPAGPAYVAGALLRAGHTLEVFDCLLSQNPEDELALHTAHFQPDLIGVSIRLVHGFIIDPAAPWGTRHLDLRPGVRRLVGALRRMSGAPIILGGPGFNYFGREWLEYLDLEYGIRGEADLSFPLFLERLEMGGVLSTVPGCVQRRGANVSKACRDRVEPLDRCAYPAYELFDMEGYQSMKIAPGITSKRGCAFHCIYCPYRSLEGERYRLKTPRRVVDEIAHIQQKCRCGNVTFCENNFNVPRQHAEAVCTELINRKLDISWSSGDLRPLGISPEFCALLRSSGCSSVNLSIESGSADMLRRMRRGYTP